MLPKPVCEYCVLTCARAGRQLSERHWNRVHGGVPTTQHFRSLQPIENFYAVIIHVQSTYKGLQYFLNRTSKNVK